MGLLIALCATGCTATQPKDSFPLCITAEEFRAELLNFYIWLLRTDQLVIPVPPYHKTWPKSREVDPETKKPLPKPADRPVEERFEELLRDPSFHEEKESL